MEQKVKISKELGAVITLASILDMNFVKELSDFEDANPSISEEDTAILGLIAYAYNTGYAKALEDSVIKE